MHVARFIKSLLSVVTAVSTVCWVDSAVAEGFMGIGANSRLENVRALFPSAQFADLKPVWLQPHQRLISIAGSGINGQLAVKFEHEVEGSRLLAKELAVRQASRQLESWQSYLLEGLPERLERLEKNPPSDPWEVKDIRWEPPVAISLQAASRRYGVPEVDKTDEQFRRVVEWKKRGITGYISSAEQVELFIFSFTFRDHLCSNPETAPPACTESEKERQAKPVQPTRKK